MPEMTEAEHERAEKNRQARQKRLARAQLGAVIRYRDPDDGGDGKYLLAYKYDGTVIDEFDDASDAFKAQNAIAKGEKYEKKKKPGRPPKSDA